MSKYLPFSIIISLLACIQFSCKKMEAEQVAWVRIDSIGFKATPANNLGTIKQDFSDVWFYVNDNLQGTYELPAKFPVIMNGNASVIIMPGFRMNGFSTQRPIYTVVEPFKDVWNFKIGDTIHFNPVLRYDTLRSTPYLESFELGSMSLTKTLYSSSDISLVNSASLAFEGVGCGYLSLSTSDPNSYAEILTIDSYILPKNGVPVYFEMHYKCNTPFIIRLRGITSDGYPYDFDIGGLNSSKNQWKKVYYALTPEILKFTQGNKFHLMIRVPRDLDNPMQELYLDNLKLIY